MDGIRTYLISVIAVCMLTVPAMLFVKKELPGRVVKLVGGVMILMVTVQPLIRLDGIDFTKLLDELDETYSLDMEQISETTQTRLSAYVKQAAEQVIEEKATELGAILQAEVTVSEDEYPIPQRVKLVGSLTSSQLNEISQYIQTALGIPPEQQEWKRYG